MAVDPNDLTTLARVKERLSITESSRDALLQSLITELSLTVQRLAGRLIMEQAHTHYLNGSGTQRLWLLEGPVDAVAGVAAVAYTEGTAGARDEALTTIQPYQFLIENPRDETHGADTSSAVRDGPSSLWLRSGVWTKGVRNYLVTSTAGYDVTPEVLVHQVTSLVAGKYHTREADGLRGRDIEQSSIELLSPAQLNEALERVAAPWRYRWSIL